MRMVGSAAVKWLGRSPLISVQRYLQVRDQHFEQATGLAGRGDSPSAPAIVGKIKWAQLDSNQ